MTQAIVRASLILGVLVALVIGTVKPSSDATAIFGPGGTELNALETPAGRELIIALEAQEETRNVSARNIVDMLTVDPLIAVVRGGPAAPSTAFLDWLWLHRFHLAPPNAEAFEAAAMAEEIGNARALLTSAEGMVLGDRLMRDPTGSYARVIERLDALSGQLTARKGIWQSKDETAALIFVTLADRPFETKEIALLADRIRAQAQKEGVTPHLIGPRLISAEISAETARESTRAAVLATILLLVWLIWSLRSIATLALVMLPLALGIAAATLAVQTIFGSVHVIALGFGGALTGLALDYPLHLLGHERHERNHAKRLVLIGAVTTSVGFIAMLGSGVPALMQTGVFVACGLVVSAVSARILLNDMTGTVRSLPLEGLRWNFPFRSWIELALVLGGLFSIFTATSSTPQALFDPPPHVTNSIERMREMIDLPSGRHALVVKGSTLNDLLAKEHDLAIALDEIIEQGDLGGYTMLTQIIGPGKRQGDLPTPDVFAARAEEALRTSGMAPSFAKDQKAAYRDALNSSDISSADFAAFPEMMPLAARLQRVDGMLQEQVRLTKVRDIKALESLLTSKNAELLDLAKPIEAGLVRLLKQVVLWLSIGAVGAVFCLAVGLRNWRQVISIACTTCAALGLTVIGLTLIIGPLGIFQVIALTLVVGIGVDYGLFLRLPQNKAQQSAAYRSVALCAGSTLIAFTIMAFSPVKLLHEIGLTVSLGVLAMLVLNLAQTPAHGLRSGTS